MRLRLVVLALAFAASACTEPAPEPPPQPPVQFDRVSADALAHGKRLADVLGCVGCHGDDMTGKDWSDPALGRLWTANLSRSVPLYSDAQLSAVIRGGARPDRELWDMPSHLFTQLSSSDMGALIAYLRSHKPAGVVHPPPTFEEPLRKKIADGTYLSSRAQVKKEGSVSPPDVGPGHDLARYVVRSTCAECHGMDLRGGKPDFGGQVRPDLRIAAAYDLAAFKRLMRTGIAAGNRELKLMSEVARGRYAHFTDAEVEALHRYLQRVAEVAP
jgi:cytochrome c553/cytochrome c5